MVGVGGIAAPPLIQLRRFVLSPLFACARVGNGIPGMGVLTKVMVLGVFSPSEDLLGEGGKTNRVWVAVGGGCDELET